MSYGMLRRVIVKIFVNSLSLADSFIPKMNRMMNGLSDPFSEKEILKEPMCCKGH